MPNSEVVVIGPSQAGKTVYLSAVVLAAEKNWKFEHGLNMADDPRPTDEIASAIKRVAVFPANEAMRLLTKTARRTVENGVPGFSATTTTTEYEFDLETTRSDDIKRNSWFQRPQKLSNSMRFRVFDGPGSSIFPSAYGHEENELAMREARQTIVNQAKKAEGILICLDAGNEEASGAFFYDLPEFLYEVAGRPPLHFKRIAFALTKSETIVENKRNAIQRMKALDPRPHLLKMLPNAVKNIFDWKHPDAQVCVGWVSAYGFIPNEGSPNFIRIGDGSSKLRSVQPNMKLNDKIRLWAPFRVLDPLVFLSTGIRGSLQEIREP